MTQQQPDKDAIGHIFRLAEQDIRGVVRSEQNARILADQYCLLANRQRDEIARLTLESEGRRKVLEQVGEERRAEWQRAERAEAEVARLRQDLADATEAIRPYAATLTAIRMELGAIEDVDLVEVARSLTAEMKRLIMQDIRKRERAERAEDILRGLVNAVTGEQEDPGELARALGREAPHWIARARAFVRLGEAQ